MATYRLAGTILVVLGLACIGCSASSGGASQDAGLSASDWVAFDLDSREIIPYAQPPADSGSTRWRTSLILFRRIDGAAVRLGRPLSDPVSETDERPRRDVQVAQVWIAVRELTREQWLRLGGGDGWTGLDPAVSTARSDGFALPATGMSPQAAVRLLAAASPDGWRLGLPSEDEWARACLAGSTSRFAWGDAFAVQAGVSPADYACTLENQPADPLMRGPQPVGSLRPNDLGLQDCHGNVWEMALGAAGWSARGGAWDQPVVQARASNRMVIPADQATYAVGIRPVLRR